MSDENAKDEPTQEDIYKAATQGKDAAEEIDGKKPKNSKHM